MQQTKGGAQPSPDKLSTLMQDLKETKSWNGVLAVLKKHEYWELLSSPDISQIGAGIASAIYSFRSDHCVQAYANLVENYAFGNRICSEVVDAIVNSNQPHENVNSSAHDLLAAIRTRLESPDEFLNSDNPERDFSPGKLASDDQHARQRLEVLLETVEALAEPVYDQISLFEKSFPSKLFPGYS
jgi:hypothetical protein